MRGRREVEKTLELYGDAVWRVCSLYFRAEADRQDAFQDSFVKFFLSDTVFESDAHRKAWLLRVAANTCKDMLRSSSRKDFSLEDSHHFSEPRDLDPENQPGNARSEVLDAMMALDDPPRTPIYLALYEGYTAPEIAKIVDAPVNTVYSWISRGKKMLREALSL